MKSCRVVVWSVALPTVESSPTKITHHIDWPVDWTTLSRCLLVRGWLFAHDGRPLDGVRLKVGDLCLAASTGRSRPDVRAALPSAPDDHTGFEIRGVLPTGTWSITIEARFGEGSWEVLVTHKSHIRGNRLPLWLGGGNWTDLMLFQMPAHMRHAPRVVKPETFPPSASTRASRPSLAVVTPSFRQARYLTDTLRGVLDQPDVTGNYVVQDGGSTDGSVEIIRRHAATPRSTHASLHLSAWESAPDGGQADAIARGFEKTSGGPDDLMAWINSDDFYLPGTLAFVVDYFARHPDVDVIYGHRILVDEESREIGRWFLPPHDDDVLRLNDFVPQETLFWRRRLWDKVGGLDRSFQFAMDWDLLLRFQAAGARIVRVPYFLACFRIHPVQKTSAAIHTVGQSEIDQLRARTQGRPVAPVELEKNPILLRYLRRSAWIEFLWQWGIRSG